MTATAAMGSKADMAVLAAVKELSDSPLLLLSGTSSSPMPTSEPKVVEFVTTVALGAIVALTGAATGAVTGGSGSGQAGTGAAMGVVTGGRTGGVIKGKLNDMLKLATDPTPKRPRKDLNWIVVSRIVGSAARKVTTMDRLTLAYLLRKANALCPWLDPRARPREQTQYAHHGWMRQHPTSKLERPSWFFVFECAK
jgi:hypothetical protein